MKKCVSVEVLKCLSRVAQTFRSANLAGLKTCATFFLLLASCILLHISCGGNSGGGDANTIGLQGSPPGVADAARSADTDEIRDANGATVFDERGNLVGVGTVPSDRCKSAPCEEVKEEAETPEIRRQTSVLWPSKRR